MSPDALLNFVRCQWCGGNAGAPNHRCSEEGQRLQQEATAAEVARMFAPMERKPQTRQRSKWQERPTGPIMGVACRAWQRSVHDGHLSVLITEEPMGFHLSISHRTNGKRPKPGRYPTWDEIADARYTLLPADLDFVMHLPPPDEYVALHDTTFHLHEHPERAAGPVS